MNPRDTKPTPADDPTGEEEAIEVDGTNTDQLDDRYRVRVVSASEADNQPTQSPETTSDLLKALENAAIVLGEPASPVPQPKKPEPGYNPYDTGAAKPGRKK